MPGVRILTVSHVGHTPDLRTKDADVLHFELYEVSVRQLSSEFEGATSADGARGNHLTRV